MSTTDDEHVTERKLRNLGINTDQEDLVSLSHFEERCNCDSPIGCEHKSYQHLDKNATMLKMIKKIQDLEKRIVKLEKAKSSSTSSDDSSDDDDDDEEAHTKTATDGKDKTKPRRCQDIGLFATFTGRASKGKK